MSRCDLHNIELNDCEFLHLVTAVEQDRNQTREAIRKGLAEPQDLKASDSLWEKLEVLRFERINWWVQ